MSSVSDAVGCHTPVALLVFNRPNLTARVFEVVRQMRPERLLVIADGPRSDRPDDQRLVDATRTIVERVDWDCEVSINYSATNLGVGKRVSSGIDWVFSQVDEAIILEDDCLPDPSFFSFCSRLLSRYRHDDRVMMVSGTNHVLKWREEEQDYHFSVYGSIWGWATWRRAWQHYDFDVASLDDEAVGQRVADLLGDEEQFEHRLRVCRQVRNGDVDTWDYQWTWARLARGGLSAVSAVNLVSNIGFGDTGTHTTKLNAASAHLQRYEASQSARPPAKLEADREYDRRCYLKMRLLPDADSLFVQGRESIERGRIIHALMLFEQACLASPDHLDAMYHKALALSRLGRRQKARHVLDELLDRAPDFEKAGQLRRQLDAV